MCYTILLPTIRNHTNDMEQRLYVVCNGASFYTHTHTNTDPTLHTFTTHTHLTHVIANQRNEEPNEKLVDSAALDASRPPGL